jgi:lipopolysaccharide/colanic/teichoic acid biosynthesis glycosyltransferase
MKRLFDVVIAFAGLLLLSPLFAVVSLFIKLDSRGPVFFHQERIGRNFKPFRIYKFRTMTADTQRRGSLITVEGDTRVTRVGRFLRTSKIDELPQLLNVLKGEMSLVGPRPEVGAYVQLFEADYRRLLTIRPGITDPASIRYSSEETLLSTSQNWEEEYIGKVLPEKIKLSLEYVDNHTVATDLSLIVKTVLKTSRLHRNSCRKCRFS